MAAEGEEVVADTDRADIEQTLPQLHELEFERRPRRHAGSGPIRPERGSRKRRAIELAVRRARNRANRNEHRDHVAGEPAAQLRTEVGETRGGISRVSRHDVGHEALVTSLAGTRLAAALEHDFRS